MAEDLRKELQAEYAMIQAQYETFDQRALSLKGLATPLLGAGLAAGVIQGEWIIVAVTILAALTLWVLEITWKSFQYCYRPRLRTLEAWFRSAEPGELKPFQINASWNRTWRAFRRRRFRPQLCMAWQPFIALPYALVVLAGLAGLVVIEMSPSRAKAAPEPSVRVCVVIAAAPRK